MAQLRVVPKKVMEVLRKLDLADGSVLIGEDTLESFPEDVRRKLNEADGEEFPYEFGGEPDYVFDIIGSPNHYAVEAILEYLNGNGDWDSEGGEG